MIKEAIGTGTTVDEAQEKAKVSLEAPEEAEVKYEVIDLPVKKTFGLFGGSPAKVRAFYEYEEKKVEEKKAPKKESNVKENKVIKEIVSLDDANIQIKKAHAYLLNIVKGMGISDAKIEISKDGNEHYFNIICEDDYSIVIGRRGETLDSIQYLVRLVANRGKPNDEYVHISINIGNYREKRQNTLKEIARKSANRVLKYKRNVSLDPMNPFERRIIHTAIADIKGVNSHSVGSDNNRRVIITTEGGSRGGQRGYNKGGYNKGGYNKGGYNKSGYNKNHSNNNDDRGRNNYKRDSRPKYEPSAPSRPPKSDAAGTSLYGKIEPKK